jgi:Bacterial Ig-like domain (group 2)
VWSLRVVGIQVIGLAAVVTSSCQGSTTEGGMSSLDVASVIVLPSDPTVQVGQSAQLSATLRDGGGGEITGRSVVWATSAAAIAAVSSDGLVAGQGPGTAAITATADGASGTTTVTVTESGECSTSFSNVSLPLCDGTYTKAVTASTFPRGSVIRAQNPGKVRFTGGFKAGDDLTFRGIVVVGPGEKVLGARGLYEDMSFVGGPGCGNTVNTSSHSNTTVRRSAFYGRGGRYLLMIYEETGVTLEDVIFRSDGGWGEAGSGCTEYEPTAVLNNYNSSNFTCRGCILFDGITTAHNSSEVLGGLGVNCHNSSAVMLFENNLIVNSRAGYYAEGRGSCDGVTVRNSAALASGSANNRWGYNRNVGGKTTLVNFTTDGFCSAWDGSNTLVDSKVDGQINDCAGPTDGVGATITLNASFLDNPRWRREMCDEAGVTRGWCATNMKLSEYLESF